jgi:DNA-binding HxlR family transcriptional regulator
MRDKKRRTNDCHYGCSVEAALDVIGGKWKGVILFHLLDGKKRFNELRRLIPSVTLRMLTLQLRELEQDEVVVRTVYPQVPPKVEYSLTDFGKSLKPILLKLRDWGQPIMTREKARQ